MPSVVVDVRVGVGDRVEADQILAVVEAMKMELAVRAPFAGTVTAVAVRSGQRVALEAPLITVDPDPDPSARVWGSVAGPVTPGSADTGPGRAQL